MYNNSKHQGGYYGQQQDGGGSGRSYNHQNAMAYADAIKAGQRSSQNFKNAWHSYCDTNGQNMYDPAKQNVEFIQAFMDQLGQYYLTHVGQDSGYKGQNNNYQGRNSGGNNNQQRFQGHGGGGGRGGGHTNNSSFANLDPSLQRVIEMVKQGQRNSLQWKNMWIDWCQINGNGIHDPTRHNAIFVIAFVLKYGLAEVVTADWAAPYLVSLGELAKPYMVQTIKKGQGVNEVWKEQWGLFADGKAHGTRDPNRHDAGSLMEFFDTIAMQHFSHEEFMLPFINGSQMD